MLVCCDEARPPHPGLRPDLSPKGEVPPWRTRFFTSPFGGEVAAQRRVRGPFSAMEGIAP